MAGIALTILTPPSLANAGIADFFSEVYGAELDGSRDSKESVIGYGLQTHRIDDTKKFLMVGDRFHDIVGAHAHSMDVAAVLYGFGSREEFEQHQADYILESFTELLSICK